MFDIPKEGFGSTEAIGSMEAKSLEETTFEPAAYVEGMGEFQQAEALQVSLETVIASLPREGVSTLPGPMPSPTEGVSSLPIPLPLPSEEVSSLPIPLPLPAEEVSSLPEPIPGSKGGVSDLPGPMPSPTEGVSTLPGPLPRPTEGVSSLPLPLPRPAEGMSDGLSAVEAGKMEIPEAGGYGSEAMVKEQAGVAEVPSAADRGMETASTLPLPMPAPFFEEVGTPAIDRLASVEAMPAGMGEIAELPTGDAKAAAPESATKAGFTAGAGSLPKNLPEDSVPLAGIGTGEMVEETSTPFTPGFPTGLPTQDNLDMRPGGEGGSGSSGKVYGNVPGFKGASYGDSDMPSSYSGGMPTSGLPGGSKSEFMGVENQEGSHSSGGGAPVDDPRDGRSSGGTIGPGALWYWEEIEGGSEDACDGAASRMGELLAMKAEGSYATVECRDGDVVITYDIYDDGTIIKHTPEYKPKPQQGLDDMSPTPYTGSGHWEPIKEQKEDDTGQVLPEADLDGLDGTVWRSDPDRTDDSGQFYGGILGDPLKKYPDSGGARPIDPIAAGLEVQSSKQASSDEQDNDESMQEPNEGDVPEEDEPVQL